MSLNIEDYSSVKAVGHSIYMDAVAEELSLGKPAVDAVRLTTPVCRLSITSTERFQYATSIQQAATGHWIFRRRASGSE